jgi:hypothetical protein
MMQLEWIALPVTQYALTGVGLLSSLTLWAGSKAEIRRMRTSMRNSLQNVESGMSTLNNSIEDVRNTRVVAPEPAPVAAAPVAAAPAPMPVIQGLNLTRRTQVLRMRKRGDNVHSIAAALQLPIGEVTLMLKMESLQNAAELNSAAPKPLARSAARGIL